MLFALAPKSRHEYAMENSLLSLEEYTKYREETSQPLYNAYIKLLDPPRSDPIKFTPDVSDAFHNMSTPHGNRRKPSTDWIMQLYGSDIIRKYGDLWMGEKRLLPIGLASMLHEEKFRWQG